MRSFCYAIALAVALSGLGTAPLSAKSHRTAPCAFPDGWNPADHQRQLDGLPPDAHHMCELDAGGRLIDSHGRQTK